MCACTCVFKFVCMGPAHTCASARGVHVQTCVCVCVCGHLTPLCTSTCGFFPLCSGKHLSPTAPVSSWVLGCSCKTFWFLSCLLEQHLGGGAHFVGLCGEPPQKVWHPGQEASVCPRTHWVPAGQGAHFPLPLPKHPHTPPGPTVTHTPRLPSSAAPNSPRGHGRGWPAGTPDVPGLIPNCPHSAPRGAPSPALPLGAGVGCARAVSVPVPVSALLPVPVSVPLSVPVPLPVPVPCLCLCPCPCWCRCRCPFPCPFPCPCPCRCRCPWPFPCPCPFPVPIAHGPCPMRCALFCCHLVPPHGESQQGAHRPWPPRLDRASVQLALEKPPVPLGTPWCPL